MVELTAAFSKTFRGGPTIEADLRLETGKSPVTVLFGPSGSGKTTLLRCLAGLERPDEGKITFGGEVWFDSSAGISTSPQRRRIGFLFQEYALFPHLSVRENVAFGLDHAGAGARVEGLLRVMELEGAAGRRPAELSGGERQRVALARALAVRPRLLLLDEPLSALDAPNRDRLRSELRRRLAGSGVPAIVVTHDRLEALALGDRIAVMSEGRILQSGQVEEVFSRPADLEVARIVGVETVVAGRVLSKEGGLATVEAGGVRLLALDPGGLDGEVLICIRAEEVTLEGASPGRSSARNRVSGKVVGLSPEGPLVRVEIDCGFRLAALVTRQAREELGLSEGDSITAVVKAPAVHLIPRDVVEPSAT